MIETVEDLIQTSYKYAKSKYTPSAQRARWIKLAGQMIWYKDQILKNTSLEAMEIEMGKLKQRVLEGEEWRNRQSVTMRRRRIVFRKPGDNHAQDLDKAESSENVVDAEASGASNAEEPEDGKETVTSSAE